MINFSKPCQYMRIVFIRNRTFMKHNKRYYSTELDQLDKHHYLNKKTVKKYSFVSYFTLIVPVICFSLTIWQVSRKRWKDQLIRDLEKLIYLPAMELPEDLTDRLKLEYRKVKVRGTFDHSREMFIGPRSKIIDNKFAPALPFIMPSFGTEPEKPNIGCIVVTPFKVADRDVEILVNRGWIPMDGRDPATRADGQIEGEVEIEGIVRLKEKEPSSGGGFGYEPGCFSYRDIESMAELAGTSHFYIDLVHDNNVPGGPLAGQTQVNISNKHLEYILTWGFLGTYTGYMWYRRWVCKMF